MKRILFFCSVLMLVSSCAFIKFKENDGDYKFKIVDWKCDKNNNLMIKFKGYPEGTEFWTREMKDDGTFKKCGDE